MYEFCEYTGNGIVLFFWNDSEKLGDLRHFPFENIGRDVARLGTSLIVFYPTFKRERNLCKIRK